MSIHSPIVPAFNHRLVLDNPQIDWPADVIAEAEAMRDADALRALRSFERAPVAPDDSADGGLVALLTGIAIGAAGGVGYTLLLQGALA